MSTINEATAAVYERVRDNWTATAPYATTVTRENEPFKPPAETPWIRVTVRDRPTPVPMRGPIGGRRFMRQAMIMVQVFTPIGSGVKARNTITHAVLTLFEGVSFSDLDCNQGSVQPVGAVDGRWDLAVVEILFNYYEIK